MLDIKALTKINCPKCGTNTEVDLILNEFYRLHDSTTKEFINDLTLFNKKLFESKSNFMEQMSTLPKGTYCGCPKCGNNVYKGDKNGS